MNQMLELLDLKIRDLPTGANVLLPVDYLRERADLVETDESNNAVGPRVDLTVDEVAELFGKSSSTVREWCASGQLEAYKLNGRQWRIRREAIADFQDRQRLSASEPAGQPERSSTPVSLASWRAA